MTAEEKIDVEVVDEKKEEKKGIFTKIGEGIDNGINTVANGIRKHKAIAVAGATVAVIGIAKVASNFKDTDDENDNETVGCLETDSDILDVEPIEAESVGETEETVA